MAKAKKEIKKEVKRGLDIKLKTELSDKGRLTVTVTLLEDGKEIASDYDFVQVK